MIILSEFCRQGNTRDAKYISPEMQPWILRGVCCYSLCVRCYQLLLAASCDLSVLLFANDSDSLLFDILFFWPLLASFYVATCYCCSFFLPSGYLFRILVTFCYSPIFATRYILLYLLLTFCSSFFPYYSLHLVNSLWNNATSLYPVRGERK